MQKPKSKYSHIQNQAINIGNKINQNVKVMQKMYIIHIVLMLALNIKLNSSSILTWTSHRGDTSLGYLLVTGIFILFWIS